MACGNGDAGIISDNIGSLDIVIKPGPGFTGYGMGVVPTTKFPLILSGDFAVPHLAGSGHSYGVEPVFSVVRSLDAGVARPVRRVAAARSNGSPNSAGTK